MSLIQNCSGLVMLQTHLSLLPVLDLDTACSSSTLYFYSRVGGFPPYSSIPCNLPYILDYIALKSISWHICGLLKGGAYLYSSSENQQLARGWTHNIPSKNVFEYIGEWKSIPLSFQLEFLHMVIKFQSRWILLNQEYSLREDNFD